MNHHFYIFLDKILPGTSARIVAKKVATDMLVMAPIAACSFYTGKWTGLLTRLGESLVDRPARMHA